MEAILAATPNPADGEEHLAALTAGERTTWAKLRDTVFAKGVNRASLQTVESAAFVLSLDEEPMEFDLKHPEKLDRFGAQLLHGKGYDRWFDKSFTVCVGSNGRVSVHMHFFKIDFINFFFISYRLALMPNTLGKCWGERGKCVYAYVQYLSFVVSERIRKF